MVFGTTTFRETAQMMSRLDADLFDEWALRTLRMPATVVSSTCSTLRSQASPSPTWALMAAGLEEDPGSRLGYVGTVCVDDDFE